MQSINSGFWRGAVISIVGFMALGFVYLTFDAAYIVERGIDKGMYQELYDEPVLRDAVGLPASPAKLTEQAKELRELRNGPERNGAKAVKLEETLDKYRADALAAWRKLSDADRAKVAGLMFTEIDLTPDEFARLKAHGSSAPATSGSR